MSGHYAVGFPPVSRADARVLILGSLPGVRSLADVQYYAQPQNAFWRIMGDLVGAGPDMDYSDRLERVMDHRIAIWDVVMAGVRPGSLDSAIVRSSIECNDFGAFFEKHRDIALICFNGKTAAELYRRRVVPGLPQSSAEIESQTLPSTSPAFAGMSYVDKLRKWTNALSNGLAHIRAQ